MYLYKIGYGTCEESEFVELYHNEKFTDEQLEKLVHECYFDVVHTLASATDDTLLNNSDYRSVGYWLKFSNDQHYPSFQ